MKKFLVLTLSLLMVLSIVACGQKKPASSTENNPQPEQTTVDSGSESQTNKPEENTQNVSSTTGYNFSGYTETADWPGEDCWKAYGLPTLPMSDDVNGSVHISDKDWIYPLNGSDGIMIEAYPGSSQIDTIVGILNDAGIAMEIDEDFENGYTAYYQNGGTNMKITVSETGSGRLTITIITEPTN